MQCWVLQPNLPCLISAHKMCTPVSRELLCRITLPPLMNCTDMIVNKYCPRSDIFFRKVPKPHVVLSRIGPTDLLPVFEKVRNVRCRVLEYLLESFHHVVYVVRRWRRNVLKDSVLPRPDVFELRQGQVIGQLKLSPVIQSWIWPAANPNAKLRSLVRIPAIMVTANLHNEEIRADLPLVDRVTRRLRLETVFLKPRPKHAAQNPICVLSLHLSA